jgi:hypothetical protein
VSCLATQLVDDGFTFRIEKVIVDEIPAHARYYAAVHKDGGRKNNAQRKGVILERIVVLRKVRRELSRMSTCASAEINKYWKQTLHLPKHLQDLEGLYMKWNGLEEEWASLERDETLTYGKRD